MSSLSQKMHFFGQWNPDGVEFDKPDLEVSLNVAPVYGAHRPIDQLIEISEQTDANPITAGYAHLASQAAPDQRITPVGPPITWSDTDETGWYNQEGEDIHDETDDGAKSINGFSSDDESFVFTIDNDGINESNYKGWSLAEPRIIPSSFSGTPKIVLRTRYKNPTGTSTPKVEFFLADDSGDIVGSEASPRFVTITNAAGVTEFEELSYNLTAGEQTSLLAADWSKLDLMVRANIPDALADGDMTNPVADIQKAGWVGAGDEVQSTTNLYENILRSHGIAVPEFYESHIRTSLGAGESNTYICQFDSIDSAWADIGEMHPFFAFSADKEDVAIKVELIQVDASGADSEAGETFTIYGEVPYRIVYTWDKSNIGTTEESAGVDAITGIVAIADLNEPDFEEKFYLAITFTYAGDGGTGAPTQVGPDGPDPIGVNGMSGNASDLATDDSNGITWNTTDLEQFSLTFPASMADASSNQGRKLTIKGSPNMQMGVTLRGTNTETGATVAIEQFGLIDLGSSGVYTETFNSGYREHTDVEMFIQCSTAAGNKLTYVEYEYIADTARPKVYGAAFGKDEPVGRALAISHLYLEAETDVNLNQVDRIEVYVGNKTDIYQVTSDAWLNYTRGAGADDYGDETTDTPRIWDFCSWGDDIIATNYADEVQRLELGNSAFDNLITSTEKPQARFCAVVGAQLILADINPSSYSEGKPFSIWASAILDPTTFEIADYDTQSAIFSLIAQPGGVTGLVGGEYGIVFKRNSIWRMSYVGLPVVFDFDHISIGQGTGFPQSIVQVDQDVYFWGNGGIFRVNQGQQLERLSGGRVEKLIFDDRWEEYAIQSDYGPDTIENESIVHGCYDSYTGLVWWFYRGPGDDLHQMSHFLMYNPREDRFSHGKIDGANFTTAVSRANVSVKELGVHRGLEVITYSGTAAGYSKFQGESTEIGTLVSKIMSPRAFDYDHGREIEIQAVRPIYRGQPDNYRPNITIKVESAQDPNMSVGLQTFTVDARHINDDGWMHPKTINVGEFHRFTVTLPEMGKGFIKEFLGVQTRIRAAGDE